MKKVSFSCTSIQEKLTPVHWFTATIATFLLIGASFYFFHFNPRSEIIEKLSSDIIGQEKQLTKLKQAAVQVEILQGELQELEEEFVQMLTLLPDQKEIPGLLENVSQVGAEVGLENILFQPQPEQVCEFYAAIPVRLDLVGNFHKLGVFFDKVSKLNRILKVENLTLVRQVDGSQLHVACTVVTYRYTDKPPAEAELEKK